ncbi:molybdopterin-dependent oxidoreductase [Neorhizobium galegae]|uniref:molybdopterin-dependent oxidoreductase n=1 Tax=Neorhizobium galegae TaxID=399 RepID=UPI000621F795|nr:molybdopterin-dependent oxidoreductase [Neorhizobium galegae]CDZ63786.1 Putative BIOTIN SULFOXIDE REDUCTASE BISC [Neorhizobium galegae bv. orientalis]KAB1120405.1 molybdopterin-dependent oxidoreductase [Neorhizobium galegae]MCQ1569911.1 molybdopterin-dependent oxidoreductase [Neorhizobium galegae]MCQ1810829.1 molybdopterin-dependent oxidoreductase [Neorhizobium galegae]CDZ67246.1 Putative BIOTIN SULFOXIDE REDUCTASE BISC [Neorhizobium galegae bv. orientalis]
MTKAPKTMQHSEPSADRRHVGTHWGFYSHDGLDGAIRPMAGDPDPVRFGGELPADRLAPCRILRPAVRRSFLEKGPGYRAGRRGAEAFVEVSWDEALELVAGEIRRVRDEHGNGAIFSGSYGWSSAGRFHHAQSQLKRFFNMNGGSVRSVQSYSYAAGEIILPHVIGSTDGLITGHSPWSQIVGHADLIVMFGGTPLRNAQVNAGGVSRHETRQGLLDCKEAGAHFINIGPVRDDAAGELDAQWMALKPGTDAALLLAIAHVLIQEDRHDTGFIDRYTVGFETLRDYLFGKVDGVIKDVAWAAGITGLGAQDILTLARNMASRKTFIMMAWALQRADHGEQAYWAAIAVASLLGRIGLPGGGFGFGYASVSGIGQPAPAVKWPSLPQGQNAISDYIPVARIADMLLSPGTEYDHNGNKRIYPEIRLIYWAGGNPFHHHQDLHRLVEAWQKPETIIVHEHWWNANARHADIVLPAATFLERDDLVASGRDSFLGYSTHTTAPPADVFSDHEILRRIAKRLGTEAAFTDGLSESEWLEKLYAEAQASAALRDISLPDFPTFRNTGLIEVESQNADRPFLAAFRADPVAHPLHTPSGLIELSSELIAGFDYADCPGHPAWVEPVEWLGSKLAAIYPLHLLSCQPHDKLHSQWDHAAPSRRTKSGGRQPVRIHPDDASARGLAQGEVVTISNARGACLAVVAITDAVMPGVVQLATGAWFDPADPSKPGSLELNGNPNVLTPDHGTSRLTQGPSPNSCLVEISRFIGKPPEVRAYRPPDLAPDPRSKASNGKECP